MSMSKPGFSWIKYVLWTVVILLAGLSTRQAFLLSERGRQLDKNTARNHDLQRRLDELSRAAAAHPPAPPPAPAPRVSLPAPPASTSAAAAAEEQVERLKASLAQANRELSRLSSRVTDLEAQTADLSQENRRLSAGGEELKKNLAQADQAMQTIQSEVKLNSGQVAELETANARLRDEAAAGKRSAAEVKQVTSELESVFRRREMYLNNVVRRYKDVTEQYRALSGVLDSRRDRQGAPLGGSEISRIQNTIAMAEEDLKQIQTLNAQAQRLQKKFPAQ